MTSSRIQALEELIAADPDDPDLHFLLGKALLDEGRTAEASTRLEMAAERNPGLAAIRRHWGEAVRDAGHPDRAREIWIQGIELAEKTGDLQAGKEMKALLLKLPGNARH